MVSIAIGLLIIIAVGSVAGAYHPVSWVGRSLAAAGMLAGVLVTAVMLAGCASQDGSAGAAEREFITICQELSRRGTPHALCREMRGGMDYHALLPELRRAL